MCNVLLGQIMRLRFLFSENTFRAKQRLFFSKKKVKATFLHRKCHSWSHCSPPPPQKRPKCHPHVNVSSSVGRLLYFGIPRLLRYSFFRMTDLHAANLRRFVASFKKNGGVDDVNRRQLLNEFQVKRILLWWQEKRESLCSGRSRTGMGGLFPDTVLPFSPSSYHIPKTETQKIGRRKWPYTKQLLCRRHTTSFHSVAN